MDEEALNSRLSRISTLWSLLDDAGRGENSRVRDAQVRLFQRYQGAAYRYLLGAVRDPDVADELFQEFALRCLQGGFRRAERGRGKFRNYLKTILYHLAADHFLKQRRSPRQLDPAATPPEADSWDPQESDARFLASWRDELLARVWAVLHEEQRNGGPPYYSVLKLRAENPKLTSCEMAARLNEQLRPARAYTETGIRKTLERARKRFANLLIDEVKHSLDQPSDEELEQELIQLGLLSYCRFVLADRLSHPRSDPL
jgi:RNA polymerase sigma-70 factor (ECF subfamily)